MRQSEVNGTYDRLAPRYDDWSARVVPALREQWARKVGDFIERGERVVELGCGTGVPVGRLLSERYGYTGVDASAEMLGKARATLPHATLMHADMSTVEFPTQSIGAVISFYAISHLAREHHAQLFGSIASWLRADGVFVGNLSSHDDPESVEASWLEAGPMRWSGFDATANEQLLADVGLRIVESDIIHQVEPDGCQIRPMWFVGQRVPTP